MKSAIVTLLFFLLSSTASAREAPTNATLVFKTGAGSENLLDDVALNDGTEANRTITLTLQKKWSKVLVKVFYTNSSATTVTATISASQDGTNFAVKTTKSCAQGTCTIYPRVDSNPVSGDEDFELEIDVKGQEKLKVVFGGASADASDLIDIQAVAVVGD